MRRYSATILTLPLALLIAACGEQTSDYEMTDLSDNVLLAEWTGPYGGVPAFDKMDLAAVKPALEKGMELELAEVDAIADNSEPPTFENTIVALEGVGQDLDRVGTYRGIWSSNMSSPEYREIQMEMAPKMAAHRSKITQNEALFDATAARAGVRQVRAQWRDARGRGQGTLRGDQPASRGGAHAVRQQRAGRRRGLRHVPERRPVGRSSGSVRRCGGHGGVRSRTRRRVRGHEHTLFHGPVPHVLR